MRFSLLSFKCSNWKSARTLERVDRLLYRRTFLKLRQYELTKHSDLNAIHNSMTLGFYSWWGFSSHKRRHQAPSSPRSKCLMQLIAAQLAALLQLTQLWTVLGRLAPPAVGNTDDQAIHRGDLLLYLEALQNLRAPKCKTSWRQQCLYDTWTGPGVSNEIQCNGMFLLRRRLARMGPRCDLCLRWPHRWFPCCC